MNLSKKLTNIGFKQKQCKLYF